MRAARHAARAVGLYADGDAVERVMRVEAHLTRQLGLTLELLEKLRGGSVRGGDRVGVLVRQVAGGAPPPLQSSAAVGSFRSGGDGDQSNDILSASVARGGRQRARAINPSHVVG